MIGALFRIRKYMRDARKGIDNPSNFAFEQIAEMALMPFLIPGIALLILLIALGIGGFSNLIFNGGNAIIRIFFWFFLAFAGITATGMTIVYRQVRKLWKNTTQDISVADKKLQEIVALHNKEN